MTSYDISVLLAGACLGHEGIFASRLAVQIAARGCGAELDHVSSLTI